MKSRRHLGLMLAVVSATAIALLPALTYANGRVVRFQREIAGAYEIALGTIPAAPGPGNLHFTMTVASAADGRYILNANVSVAGRAPGAETNEIGPLAAQTNEQNASFYEVSTSVDREGDWTFTVTVSGELGDASADFDVEVRKASPFIGFATLLTLLVLLTVLGLSARALIGERRKRRKS